MATGPLGRGHLALARAARRACPIFEPVRLAAHARARCPRPQGPVVGRGRSQTPGARRFCGAYLLARPCSSDGAPGGEGILPSHAPPGAHVLSSNQCALRRMRGQDALAPKGPWLAEAVRRLPARRICGVYLPARPCSGDGAPGARASCPRTRRQARVPYLRINAPCGACEGKMPSPPGPVADRSRPQTPVPFYAAYLRLPRR